MPKANPTKSSAAVRRHVPPPTRASANPSAPTIPQISGSILTSFTPDRPFSCGGEPTGRRPRSGLGAGRFPVDIENERAPPSTASGKSTPSNRFATIAGMLRTGCSPPLAQRSVEECRGLLELRQRARGGERQSAAQVPPFLLRWRRGASHSGSAHLAFRRDPRIVWPVELRVAFDTCRTPTNLRRTLTIALGHAIAATGLKIGFNFVVPFIVSNLGVLAGTRTAKA